MYSISLLLRVNLRAYGAWMRGKVDNEGQVCQIMKMSALFESLDSLSSKLIDSSLLKRWQRFLT